MDIDKLVAKLRKMPVKDRRVLAEKSGVAYTTINNIAYSYTYNPSVRTMVALHKATSSRA